MPSTSLTVNFKGKESNLLSLLDNIIRRSDQLESSLRRLESTVNRVDGGLARLNNTAGNSRTQIGNVTTGVNTLNNALNSTSRLSTIFSTLSSRASSFNLSNASQTTNSFLTSLGKITSIGRTVFNGLSNIATNSIGTIYNTVGRIGSGIRTTISGAYSSFKGFFDFVDRSLLTFGNSIRQIGQGLQSFGITLTAFVSLPIMGILRGALTEAINFDDQMIKVRKTTGAVGDEFKLLKDRITQASLGTPTSREDLAKIAEDWGAIGLNINKAVDVDALLEAVRVTDMLVTASEDIEAANAVDLIGRFAAIYYPDVHEFVAEYEKLGSVLETLENINPVSGGKILAAAQRLAPTTKALGISPEDALAMAAAVASVNVSAERAGTQTASAITDIAVNFKEVAKMTGMSEQAIHDWMATNPDEFFYSLAASIAAVEDPLERIAIADQLVGKVGSKSLLGLAGSLPNLTKNLEAANSAFVAGTALQKQFDAALDSTKNQLGILRNNITYAGSAISDALLPYITKFVLLAVPAIQMLTNWFKALDERTKVQIAGWALLLAIAGPVLVFFSSLVFMLGLVFSGFSSMIGLIGLFIGGIASIVSGIGGFIAFLYGLLTPINLLITAVAGLAIMATVFATDLKNTGNLINGYISSFYEWGYNLISSFSSGIIDAGRAAYNAVLSVINAFISLIQSFSPPREGPLKQISQWGENLMHSYGDGIRKGAKVVASSVLGVGNAIRQTLENMTGGQVDLLDTLFSKASSIINSVANHLGLSTDQINNRIATASQSIANFVSTMDFSFLENLRPLLGGLLSDFTELAALESKYAKNAERLKEIDKALKGINKTTDEQIQKIVTQTGLTSDQQAAMIRQAKLQGSVSEDKLNSEKESLEEQQDSLKDDIKRREQIIDMLTKLMFGQTADGHTSFEHNKPDKPDKLPKPEDIIPFEMKDINDITSGLSKVEEKFNKTGEAAKTFTEKLGDAKLMVEGFVAAIKGDDKENYSNMPDAFWKGWEQGENVRIKVMDFLEKFEKAIERFRGIKGVINDEGLKFLFGLEQGSKGGKLNWEVINYMFANGMAMAALGVLAGAAYSKVKEFYDFLFTTKRGEKEQTLFEMSLQRVSDAVTAFKDSFNTATKDINWSEFIQNLGIISGALATLLTSQPVWAILGFTLGVILRIVVDLTDAFSGLILMVDSLFTKDEEERVRKFNTGFSKLLDVLVWANPQLAFALMLWKKVSEIWWELGKTIDGLVSKISTSVSRMKDLGLKATLEEFIINPIKERLGMAYDEIFKLWTAIWLIPRAVMTGGATLPLDVGILTAENQTESSLGEQNTKSMSDPGKEMADSWIKSIVKNLVTDNNKSVIGSALMLLMNGTVTSQSTIEGVNLQGKNTGQLLLDGMKLLFESQGPVDLAFNAFKLAMGIWYGNNKEQIISDSELIGTDVVTGVENITKSDDKGWWGLLNRFRNWIGEEDTLKNIATTALSIAQSIVDAIGKGFTKTTSNWWSSMKGHFDDLVDAILENMPDWMRWLFGIEKQPSDTKPKNQSPEGTTGSSQASQENKKSRLSLAPSYFIPESSNPVNIVINISSDVASKIDKRMINELADTIYRRIVNDMRLAGI